MGGELSTEDSADSAQLIERLVGALQIPINDDVIITYAMRLRCDCCCVVLSLSTISLTICQSFCTVIVLYCVVLWYWIGVLAGTDECECRIFFAITINQQYN